MSRDVGLVRVIPAVVAPQREGFELELARLPAKSGERFLLRARGGEAFLDLKAQQGEFLFSYGDAAIRRPRSRRGALFVDALAEWLGLGLSGTSAKEDGRRRLKCSWGRLGRGADHSGVEWETFKMFFRLGDRSAELFLRLTPSRSRGQFLEKWSQYRRPLVEIFERVLSADPPRRVRKRRLEPPAATGRVLSVNGGMEVSIPAGMRLEEVERHWRMTDAENEFLIELSCLALPELKAGAPSVPERLSLLISSSEHANAASPVATFERDGAQFAWSEYAWSSKDTERPEAAPRPARGRWLICANEWFQGLVTGCWWESDVQRATAAWNEVVDSIRLSGRIRNPEEPMVRG
ncbi:MAG TPA: hypothetical protein VFB61_11705 [Gemmatimonadales bacterium]|nr:hypothetical protein [Gemmatimonadales bacterium]